MLFIALAISGVVYVQEDAALGSPAAFAASSVANPSKEKLLVPSILTVLTSFRSPNQLPFLPSVDRRL